MSLNRRIPFIENFHSMPTNQLPVFAGFHRSKGKRDGKFHGAFTLKYPNGYYIMLPTFTRKGGGLQAKAAKAPIDSEVSF